MKLLDYEIKCASRSDAFYLYAIGDAHVGARNCAESHLRRLVKHIKDRPNARWIGGGDYIQAINPKDSKRFSFRALPDWIIDGKADTVRERLADIIQQEIDRFVDIVEPIQGQCIGLAEGNHESEAQKHHNIAVHRKICEKLGMPDLTDSAFVRLRFKRGVCSQTVILFICHGFGGGRTAGAEPNHLCRLAADKEADIVLRGHSHSFCICPPIVTLSIPSSGKLPDECHQSYKRAGNWGAWLKSYAAGPPTYDSQACYPARSLSTLEIRIEPHRHVYGDGVHPGRISMSELVI